MTEIRSYRRVFDLERRIYSIDRFRLNPSGVPVRGILYFVALLGVSLALARLPLIGAMLTGAPWYVRELALPALAAVPLTMIRIDGRAAHRALGAASRLSVGPRRVTSLSSASQIGVRWVPSPVLVLPQGCDARLRRMRYEGPGAVSVRVAHSRSGASERDGVGSTLGRQVVELRPLAGGGGHGPGQVIVLRRGVVLVVDPRPAA